MGVSTKSKAGIAGFERYFGMYRRCSRAFKEICASYAPVMESFSIDEVFLDMTGTSLIYPDPIQTAHEIKDKIKMSLDLPSM